MYQKIVNKCYLTTRNYDIFQKETTGERQKLKNTTLLKKKQICYRLLII